MICLVWGICGRRSIHSFVMLCNNNENTYNNSNNRLLVRYMAKAYIHMLFYNQYYGQVSLYKYLIVGNALKVWCRKTNLSLDCLSECLSTKNERQTQQIVVIKLQSHQEESQLWLLLWKYRKTVFSASSYLSNIFNFVLEEYTWDVLK